ncbi:hypothetical protein EST38_g2696 [Candolleomyces aberdarensis]|uniref:Uncharacterized protein n=1 Tax=Candolleomyces aberdarensis TaxID=2316362 RepID=A0A4Q2DSA0_9AGAR|nr:hypothetical protein EST38_g2696 [Candolleomyces aberdarensis]
MHDLLRHCCQSVESLTLDLSAEGFFDEPYAPAFLDLTRSKFRLPGLHALTLQKATPKGLNILEVLHAPGLVSLAIQLEHNPFNETEAEGLPPKFLSFIIESQRQKALRSLSISEGSFNAREMAELLFNLPSLSHLSLDNVQFNDGQGPFGKRADMDGTNYLPKLEVLELRRLSPNFDFEAINEFMLCRRQSDNASRYGYTFDRPDTLREVIITFRKATRLKKEHKYDDDAAINALRRSCGMVVTVSPREYDEDYEANVRPDWNDDIY